MPEWAVREMIADWLGAARSYDGAWPQSNRWPWFEREWPILRYQLHPETVRLIDRVLTELNLMGVYRQGDLIDRVVEKTWAQRTKPDDGMARPETRDGLQALRQALIDKQPNYSSDPAK